MTRYTLATVTADVKRSVEQGRKHTDARNAFAAVAVLIHGSTQRALIDATGIDKSDLARIIRTVKADKGAMEALTALAAELETASASKRVTLAAAYGESFTRRTRTKVATKQPAPVKSAHEPTDGEQPETNGTPAQRGSAVVEGEAVTAADLLAALATIRDAARTVKWSDDQSAELSAIAMVFFDIAAA